MNLLSAVCRAQVHKNCFSCYNNLDPDPDPKANNQDQIHWQKPVIFPDECDATWLKGAVFSAYHPNREISIPRVWFPNSIGS